MQKKMRIMLYQKKPLLFIIMIMVISILGSGCQKNQIAEESISDKPSQEIEESASDKHSQETAESVPDKHSQEYLQQYESTPINKEDYTRYMFGNKVYSNNIYYDDASDKIMNEVVCVAENSSRWYKGKVYYTYNLELKDNEWKIRAEMKEAQQSYDSVRKEKFEDNISGSYNIYFVEKFPLSKEYLAFAKTEEWVPYKSAAELNDRGEAEILLRAFDNSDNPDNPLCLDISGYLSIYDISNVGLTIYNVKGTELNWQYESNGFLVTNNDSKKYTIKILFKESTGEILLEKIRHRTKESGKEDDVYLFKFIKK